MSEEEKSARNVYDPTYVVTVPVATYQATLGSYFMGQTKMLNFGDDANAWGGLYNPADSEVNVYINVFTISNYTACPFAAQEWFGATVAGPFAVSDKVMSANRILMPRPTPKGELRYSSQAAERPGGGINPFSRIIPREATLVDEKEGRLILGPGDMFLVYLVSPGAGPLKARVALGWWEEELG